MAAARRYAPQTFGHGPIDVTRTLIGGIATTVISLVYLYFALQIRVSALADSTGAGGVPKVFGMLGIALGLILCLQALLLQTAKERAADRPEGSYPIFRAAGLLLVGIGYLLIVPYLGYIPSIALLIISVAAYQGVGATPRLLIIGVAGAIALWATFAGLLGIPMPAGMIASLFRA